MWGAIIGDIAGSRLEKTFPSGDELLFTPANRFTDDTILTCALADAKLKKVPYSDSLRLWGRRYKERGYSRKFTAWLAADNADDNLTHSDTNGAVMRISAIPYLTAYSRLPQEVRAATKPTHNHPDAIHAAVTLAQGISILLSTKDKKIAAAHFLQQGYHVRATVRDYQQSARFDMTALGTLLRALAAWKEARSFEQAIRNAISIGGDTDTIAAVAGSLAEPTWGIPKTMVRTATTYLSQDILEVVQGVASKTQFSCPQLTSSPI